jgi:cell cycle checkpoint control protein RAD9A
VYDLDSCTNSWTIQARVMQEANGNFLASQEEVSMQVGPDFFRLKNYSEEYDEKKQVHTELSMHPGEFETYSIRQETTVTFCLKELRSLIGFAEFLQLPITASFTSGGQPLVLTVNQSSSIPPVSCVFVLATLADHMSEIPITRVATTPATKQKSNNSTAAPRTDRVTEEAAPPGRANSTELPAPSPCRTQAPVLLPSSPDLSTIAGPESVQGTPPPKKRRHKLFNRCFEATFNPSQMPGAEKVLAPDSDEEQ